MGIQINGQTDTIKAIDGTMTMPGTVTYEDVSRINVVGVVTASSFNSTTGNVVITENANVMFQNSARDTNRGAIQFTDGGDFRLRSGGALSESLRITSDGNVGINTTTFAANGTNLKVSDGTISRLALDKTGANARKFEIGNFGTGLNVYDVTADAERLRIDSVGRILAGGITSFTGEASLVLQASNAGATTQAQLWLNRGEEDPSADLVLGQIIFGDATAAGSNGAMIQARADSSWGGANGNPTRIAFFTESQGSDDGPSERLRISSSGDMGLGVSDGMNQSGTLYIVGGQAVRWTHPTDGTVYGDHYVSASGAHVFRNGSSLVSNLIVYPTHTEFQSVKYKTWTDTGAANGVTETLPLMKWNATNHSRIYGEFTCWASRSGGNQQRGYIRYAVGMTYYGGGYSGLLNEVDRTGVAGFSTLVIERSGDDIRLRHVGNTAATGATMLIEFRGSFANGASFY